jgi:hypothetical protein
MSTIENDQQNFETGEGSAHANELSVLEEQQEYLDAVAVAEAESGGVEIAVHDDDVSEEQIEIVFANIDDFDVYESDQLRGEWGIHAARNLSKIWSFMDANPALVEALDPVGADPALLRAGLILAEQWEQDHPKRESIRVGEGTNQMNTNETLQKKLDRLTAEQDAAMGRGDHTLAQEIDAQINAVAIQLSGSSAIVGGTDANGNRNF